MRDITTLCRALPTSANSGDGPQVGAPTPEELTARRIIVIDDNASIHDDFRKIIRGSTTPDNAELTEAEQALFGSTPSLEDAPVYQMDFALQGQQGVASVERAVAEGKPYALAFVDMRMPPGWDGLETIKRLWTVDPHVQVVICSAHSDYDWEGVVSALGHSDKLLVLKKPFEPIEVLQCASALTRKWQHERTLRSQVEFLEEVVALRTAGLEAANGQLRHLAAHDALTDLPNRMLLDDRLAQAIAHANRDAQPFAVLVLDLDRFKLVNDSLGHRAGDEMLKEAARRLKEVVSAGDTVARIGGDEFVLIVNPAMQAEEAESIAVRAIESLQAPMPIAGVTLRPSASVGIALYPADANSANLLLARADAAMYCAKQQGHGNVRLFAPGMDTQTRDRMQLECDLHQAVLLEQLELHYQPKVDTVTGALTGAEALIRWRHPDRGLIPPDQFIPLAEESGMIGPIGAWVIREACRQLMAWKRAGLPPLRVAVNVAATQFRQGNLLETVRDALEDTGVDPRYLELELTESAVMTNAEESAALLEQLSRMGVLLSVDDFGTGYSSMSYLRRFPIDKLKIDRSFISDLLTRHDDASIVGAIISLAHSLQLKVVAEGVETPEQLAFLQRLGCDQYQGHHFSRALPATEFSQLIQHWQQNDQAFLVPEADRTQSKLAPYQGAIARIRR